ncbi:MAG: NYN domain-containing protein, partial [Exiguobacterium acetylicum]
MKYDRLIVDGYNIIGAWPEFRTLREQDFELARERLIHAMAEYQAVTGISVTIVFDAYLQPGRESRMLKSGIDIVYTREN